MTNSVSLLEAAQLSSAAYGKGAEIPANWTLLKTFTSGVDSFTVFQNGNTLVFAFKGTDSLTQLASDLTNDGANEWENIKQLADEQFAFYSNLNPAYQIVADGHSLGGGMAQIFALENHLDGFGQNALPIAANSLAADYPINGISSDTALLQYANTFKEVNVDGDIATWFYKGKTYLDKDPTTLSAPYSSIEKFALALAVLNPIIGSAVAATVGIRAHSIDTVIALEKGQQVGSSAHDVISATDLANAISTAAPSNINIEQSENLSFNENSLGKTDNDNLAATDIKAGNPSSSGGAGIVLKVSDADGGTSGTINTMSSDVYQSGKLASKESITTNEDGSYDLTVFDPVSNATIVTAHVESNGNYTFTIDGINLQKASPEFQLPTWANIPAFLYADAWDPAEVWPDGFAGYDLGEHTVEWQKTDAGYTQTAFDSAGVQIQVAHLSANGEPIDYSFASWMFPGTWIHIAAGSFTPDDDLRFYFKTDPDNPIAFSTPTLDVPSGLDSPTADWNGDHFRIDQGPIVIYRPPIGSAHKLRTLTLDPTLTPTDINIRSIANGTAIELADGHLGDTITIQLGTSNAAGIANVKFGDGTSWSIADMLGMIAAKNQNISQIIGTAGADVLTSTAGKSYMFGGGGNDVFNVAAGDGAVEIDEQDSAQNCNNVLQLHNVALDNFSVTASVNGKDLIIKDGVTGDQIVLDQMLVDPTAGVNTVTFSDGTSLSAHQLLQMAMSGTIGNDFLVGDATGNLLDGHGGNDVVVGGGGNDTFVYNAGYGQLKISEFDWNSAANNVLQLGGLTASSLTASVSEDGTGLVIADGVAGDAITINNMLANPFSGIQAVQFSDGSSLSRLDLLQLAQTGTSGSDTLVGTSGADILDGHGGNDVVRGHGGGDTFVFAAGYGSLEIDETIVNPTEVSTLRLTGISQAAVHVAATWDGTGIVVTDDDGSDQIVIDGMLHSRTQGVQQFQFDDGTTWSRSQIIQKETTGTAGFDTLYGTSGADVFDGNGGGDYVQGNGGGDIFIFKEGYGQLEINEGDSSSTPQNVLQLGTAIDVSLVKVNESYDGTGIVLTDGIDGDQITLDNMLTSGANGVQQIQFADGTVWSRSEILQNALANCTPGDDRLFGSDGADVLDGKGGFDYVQGGGGGDTFIFNAGYGDLEINETDYSADSNNVLMLGDNISESAVTIDGSWDGTGIVLRDGNGDQITLDNMFLSSSKGVQQVQFADGTTWSRDQIIAMELASGTPGNNVLYGSGGADVFDGKGGSDYEQGNGGGDTFMFNPGYGQLTINEFDMSSSAANVLKFGAGIDPSSVILKASSNGDDLVLTDGIDGDEIYLKYMLSDNTNGVQQVQFADGTSWSRAQLFQMETTGTIGDDLLVGSPESDTFDGKGGNDRAIGHGGNDTFIFNPGYGQLEIEEYDRGSHPNNVLQLGAGISASALTVRSSNGDSLVLTDGIEGDQITIWSMLSGPEGGIQHVQFADGTTWSAEQLVRMETTGTSGNDTLYGRAFSPDVLDGKGGDDYVGSRYSNNDTFVFNKGYGHLEIESDYSPYEPGNVLKLGGGIDESSIVISKLSDDRSIVITDGTDGDQITIDMMLWGYESGIEQLQFENGTTWSRQQIIQMATNPRIYNGTSGDDTLTGQTDAVNAINGGAGNDVITAGGLSNVLAGSTGNDTIIGSTGVNFIVGGNGNDSITLGATNSVVGFNTGDGEDTIMSGTATGDTLSLGGGIADGNLTFSKNGYDLIFNTGGTDSINLQGWYADNANHNFVTLQVLEQASADYDPSASNPLVNQAVEEFDFGQLVTQFDQARTNTPGMTSWNLMNGLLSAHLSGSDTAAIGGDLAYYEGTRGSLGGMDLAAAVVTLQDAQFGRGSQTVHAWNTISQSANTLR